MQSNYLPHQPHNTLHLPFLTIPPSNPTSGHASTSKSGSDNITSLTAARVALANSNPSTVISATTSVTSCVDHDAKFFKELTASYAPASPTSSPAPESPSHSAEVGGAHILVDWQERPFPKSYSDDRERRKLRLPEDFDPSILSQPIYRPFGKWSWVDGLPITDADGEILLSSGIMCSAYIKSGKIGDRKISYISKTWLTQEKWDGFYTELALYKVQLKPLQGDVVPTIINLYSSPSKVNVAMEPPHHSFWIEASADMPHVLKKRCVEAFEKIHAQGVCHGDIELRHMLIGGDGKVTIIDFQNSRALVPNEVVNLGAATPADLRMEMRKVKFKLDYEGSRTWEDEKQIRCAQRAIKNQEERLKYSRTYGYIPKIEEDPVEDRVDPVVESQEWNLEWLQPWDPTPTRYVMPGQTEAALDQEVQRFLSIVDRMEQDESLAACLTLPSTPPSTPPHDRDSGAEALVRPGDHGLPPRRIEAEAEPSAGVNSPRYSLRKRNSPDVSSDRPGKRVRTIARSPTPSSSTDKRPHVVYTRRGKRNPPSKAHSTSLMSKKGVIQAKTSTSGNSAPAATNGESSHVLFPGRTILDLPSRPLSYRQDFGGPSGATRKSVASGLPPIKVRDFAYEPSLSTKERNSQRHYQLGLPQPEIVALNPRDPHWQAEDAEAYVRRQRAMTELVRKWKQEHPGRKVNRPRVDVGEGSLKRALEALVDSREEGAQIKKQRDLVEKGERAKRMRDESEDFDRYTSDGYPGQGKGPKILKTSGFEAHQAANAKLNYTFGIRDMLMNPIQYIIRTVANFTPVGITNDRNPTVDRLDDLMCFDDELYGEHDMDLDPRDSNEGFFDDHGYPDDPLSNVTFDAMPLERAKQELAPSSDKLELTLGMSIASQPSDGSLSGHILSGSDSVPKLLRRRSSRIHALHEHRVRGFVPQFTQVRAAPRQEPPEEEEVEAMLRPLDGLDSPPSFHPLRIWIGG